jgi:hypothetical protein
MRTSINIATMPGREEQLFRTLHSLIDQADVIRVYCNNMKKPPMFTAPKLNIEWIMGEHDLTDNGKFYALDHIIEPEFYLTCDDDIQYPPDYVSEMVKAVRSYHAIVTIHGRRLLGYGLNYYRGHQFHHCAHETKTAQILDVCGTGVTAFDTRYFHPRWLAHDPIGRMSDILFSLEAIKQKRRIVLIPKAEGWIKPQHVETSIFSTEVKTKQTKQIELCDKILELRHSRT